LGETSDTNSYPLTHSIPREYHTLCPPLFYHQDIHEQTALYLSFNSPPLEKSYEL
jgi:hypothetical protein